MKRVAILSLLLLSGCGVSLTQSGFKAGIIVEDVAMIQDDSKVYTEDIVGIKIQWLPNFTWGDISRWWKSE